MTLRIPYAGKTEEEPTGRTARRRKLNASRYQRQIHTTDKGEHKVSLLSVCSWFKNRCTPLWYCSPQREHQGTPAFILAPFPNRYSLISSWSAPQTRRHDSYRSSPLASSCNWLNRAVLLPRKKRFRPFPLQGTVSSISHTKNQQKPISKLYGRLRPSPQLSSAVFFLRKGHHYIQAFYFKDKVTHSNPLLKCFLSSKKC